MKKHFLFSLILFACSSTLFSQVMQLDSTFGLNGCTSYYYQGRYDAAYDVAVQNNGKIILVGEATYNNADAKWISERLNPDGTNDLTFGNYPPDNDGYAQTITTQPDGKYLIAGQSLSLGCVIARFEITGRPDTSFGNSGWVVIDPTPINIFTLNNGKIVIVGMQSTGISRLNNDGTVDSSFGTNGHLFIDSLEIISANIQTDEKLLLSGFLNSWGNDAELVRLDTNGVLDPTFGINGRIFPITGNLDDRIDFSMVQSDGKILIYGRILVNFIGSNFFLRLDTNGNIDNSFTHSDSSNQVYCRGIILPSDKSLFAIFVPGGFKFKQLNTDGSLDNTLINNDSVQIPSTNGGIIHRILMQNDGKILAACDFSPIPGQNFSVFRFNRYFTTSIETPDHGTDEIFHLRQQNNLLIINLSEESKFKLKNIYISDLNGKKLIEYSNSLIDKDENHFEITLKDNLADGIYLVSIETSDKKVFTKKIFIK